MVTGKKLGDRVLPKDINKVEFTFSSTTCFLSDSQPYNNKKRACVAIYSGSASSAAFVVDVPGNCH